jgi:hypothetical protein
MPRMPFQGVLVEDLLDANQGWVKPFCAGRIALLRQTWAGVNQPGRRSALRPLDGLPVEFIQELGFLSRPSCFALTRHSFFLTPSGSRCR